MTIKIPVKTEFLSEGIYPTHNLNYQLLTIKQFCEVFPWPSQAGLRSLIFRAGDLGLDEAFIRCGRRRLVDPKIFFQKIREIQNRTKKGDENEVKKRKQREVSL
jgi:hypothetical protein